MWCGISRAPTKPRATTSDLVWCQLGSKQLWGGCVGPDAILAHLGSMMGVSAGTFSLETESATESGNLVVLTVRFSAQREGAEDLDQHGVDVFRVEGDKIAEVWLISEDQAAEDAFWG